MRMLLLGLCLLSFNAFGSGKLMFEPRYNDKTQTATYLVGLGIYEKIDKGMFYNSWSGFGDAVEAENQTYKSWFVTKHQIDFKFDCGAVVSPGVRGTFMPDWGSFDEETVRTEGFIKFAYDLW